MNKYGVRFCVLGSMGANSPWHYGFEETANKIYENCRDCLVCMYGGQFQIDFIFEAESYEQYAKIVGEETANIIKTLKVGDFRIIRMDPENMEPLRTKEFPKK